MKTGVIVYMLNEEFDVDREPYIADVVKKTHDAQMVEIVSHGQEGYDVMDAWWRLTAKGMQRFICLFAVDRGGKGNGPDKKERLNVFG